MKIASVPNTEKLCSRFSVALNGEYAPVSAARVSAMIFNRGWPGHQRSLDQTEIAGFVRVQSNECVNAVVELNEVIKDACVRPLSKEIKIEQTGNTLSFVVPGAGQ